MSHSVEICGCLRVNQRPLTSRLSLVFGWIQSVVSQLNGALTLELPQTNYPKLNTGQSTTTQSISFVVEA